MQLKYIGKDGANGLRTGEVYPVQLHHVGYSVWAVVSIPGLTGVIAIRCGTLKDLQSNWEAV